MDESGLSAQHRDRHALKVLVDEGLVRTERGRGAFVADTPARPREQPGVFEAAPHQVPGSGHEAHHAHRGLALYQGRRQHPAKFYDAAVGGLARRTSPSALSGRCAAVPGDRLSTTELRGTHRPRYQRFALSPRSRQEFHRAPAQGHKTFEVCYASQNEAFLLNVERGQALILITDYVHDTDGRPLHVSKRIQRTDRAKYTEPIG